MDVLSKDTTWPDLPLAAWSETCDTLQLWTQIVGKVRITLTPLINHWWNATFFVTARGWGILRCLARTACSAEALGQRPGGDDGYCAGLQGRPADPLAC